MTLLLAVLAVARLLAQWLLQPLAGFQLLVGLLSALSWPASLRLVWLERNSLLPAVPSRGHGLPLLLYWTTALLGQAAVLVNFRSPHWWFRLSRSVHTAGPGSTAAVSYNWLTCVILCVDRLEWSLSVYDINTNLWSSQHEASIDLHALGIVIFSDHFSFGGHTNT